MHEFVMLVAIKVLKLCMFELIDKILIKQLLNNKYLNLMTNNSFILKRIKYLDIHKLNKYYFKLIKKNKRKAWLGQRRKEREAFNGI